MTDSDQLERVARALREKRDAMEQFEMPPGERMIALILAAISAMSPPPEQKPSEEAMRRVDAQFKAWGLVFGTISSLDGGKHDVRGDLAALLDRVATDERKALREMVGSPTYSVHNSVVATSAMWRLGHKDGKDDFRDAVLHYLNARTGCPKES